jgi:hypothetical protein
MKRPMSYAWLRRMQWWAFAVLLAAGLIWEGGTRLGAWLRALVGWG